MTREDYETTNVEAAARYAMEAVKDEMWVAGDRVMLSHTAMAWLASQGRVEIADREGDE